MTNNKEPHILCSIGDVCKTVLLPGDPGRVLKIIKYCDEPKKLLITVSF